MHINRIETTYFISIDAAKSLQQNSTSVSDKENIPEETINWNSRIIPKYNKNYLQQIYNQHYTECK